MRLLYGFMLIVSTIYTHAGQFANDTFSKQGNIYYKKNNIIVQLTYLGKDHFPILSPNKKFIAFVRIGRKHIPEHCRSFSDTLSDYNEQLWIMNLETKKEKRIVNSRFYCNSPTKMIINPRLLTFSPDSNILYFLTSAWVTSGAIHMVNIDGSNLHYLFPANSLDIIMHGKYKGFLIIQQHRYFHSKLGSYEGYWLYSPLGKEITSLSDAQRENLLKAIH